MLKKLKLQDIRHLLPQQRVFLRADFNVPLKEGKVSSTKRLVETIPTIKYILENSPKGIVIASHLGRPDGQAKPEFSMAPVRDEIEKLLNFKVKFAKDCVGEEAQTLSNELRNGELLLLENLRFYGEEEGSFINDKGEKTKVAKDKVAEFRKKLTSLGDLYVNDAFGTSHRAHSSIVGLNLPIRVGGLLMQKELEYFGKAIEAPEHPVVMVLGGAKVADKIPLIHNLLNFADEVIIGGGMAFTFLKELHGTAIGDSLYDSKSAADVKKIIEEAKKKGVKITLPIDFVCSKDMKDASSAKVYDLAQGVPDGWKGLDIGPKTLDLFRRSIGAAKTVVMNGPMGLFEVEGFNKGSVGVIEEIAKLSESKKGTTIVGGGDSVSLVGKVKGAAKSISHVSTGGGASLELLEGKKLPGVEYLSNISDIRK